MKRGEESKNQELIFVSLNSALGSKFVASTIMFIVEERRWREYRRMDGRELLNIYSLFSSLDINGIPLELETEGFIRLYSYFRDVGSYLLSQQNGARWMAQKALDDHHIMKKRATSPLARQAYQMTTKNKINSFRNTETAFASNEINL
jgi:hypothetical protein